MKWPVLQKKEKNERAFPVCKITGKARTIYVRGGNPGLFWEIEYAAAVVQHQQQRGQEKQGHEDVENTVPFTACVLDIFHKSCPNCSDAEKSGKNINSGEESRSAIVFFAFSECF
ncbi:MAG: hypothetical protein KDC65_03010 [Saprospiraceae bacterium]|nr:hypothetical protein [Saprospiraceae bacterium]